MKKLENLVGTNVSATLYKQQSIFSKTRSFIFFFETNRERTFCYPDQKLAHDGFKEYDISLSPKAGV